MRLTTLLLLLLICWFTSTVIAQNSGSRIVDEAGNGIAFANIGIPGSSRGTVSDARGYFSWLQQPAETETIRISAIGYHARTLSGKNFWLIVQNDSSIQLKKRVYAIETVTIKAEKAQAKIIGQSPKEDAIPYKVNTSISGAEMGTRIKGPKGDYQIRKFILHVAELQKNYVNLRLNLYQLQGDSIGERINQENIIIQPHKTGENLFDLSRYQLFHRGDVFVSLEYIDYASNVYLQLLCNRKKGQVWYKYGAQNHWQKLQAADAGGYKIAPCYRLEVVY